MSSLIFLIFASITSDVVVVGELELDAVVVGCTAGVDVVFGCVEDVVVGCTEDVDVVTEVVVVVDK
jgi:hypothetical protein